MAKIIILAYVDLTISDELAESPPYGRVASLDFELEAIISAGCAEEGFSYALPLDTVADDFSDDIYELTED